MNQDEMVLMDVTDDSGLTEEHQRALAEVRTHQDAITQNPSLPTNEKPYYDLERALQVYRTFVDGGHYKFVLKNVLGELFKTMMLQQNQGLETVIRLIIKLSEPLSFSDILNFEPPVDVVKGLALDQHIFHKLVLSLLENSSHIPEEAAAIANEPAILRGLVILWLYTESLETAAHAQRILVNLLETDLEPFPVSVHGVGPHLGNDHQYRGRGKGLIWRRFFGDVDIYGTLFYACKGDEALNRSRKSIAQGRLMDVVNEISKLDFAYVVRSHHPDIEAKYGLDPRTGLLDFVACHMSTPGEDVLMDMNFVNFYTELIDNKNTWTPATYEHQERAIAFLKLRGKHEMMLSYCLDEESSITIDATLLAPVCSKYLSKYATLFPTQFLGSDDARNTLVYLNKALDLGNNRWAQGSSPSNELHVVASIPRICLLPQRFLGIGRRSSPLLLLPCNITNAEALNTLATVFGGPAPIPDPNPPELAIDLFAESRSAASAAETDNSHTTASSEYRVPSEVINHWNAEAMAARAAFLAYYAEYPNLFIHLVNHASTPAVPDKALAALNVLRAIASASWLSLPEGQTYNSDGPPTDLLDLPSEEAFSRLILGVGPDPPRSGIDVFVEEEVMRVIIPFLLRSMQGGADRAGEVAYAKHELLKIVREKLGSVELRPQHEQIFRLLDARISAGPLGGITLSNSVATLEL